MQEYSAQNHNWGMTLHFAHRLLFLGQSKKVESFMKASCKEQGLNGSAFNESALVGSMLLSIFAIESITTSVAFEILENDFNNFDKNRGIKDRIKALFKKINTTINFSEEPFKTIKEMQDWRNSIAHFKPYKISSTTINQIEEVSNLHAKYTKNDYLNFISEENAKHFYTTAYNYIELLKKAAE